MIQSAQPGVSRGNFTDSKEYLHLQTLPKEISPNILYQQQFPAQFLEACFPSVTQNGVTLRDSINTGTWFHLLPTLKVDPPALCSSILVLCTAFIGRLREDDGLVRESLVHHGHRFEVYKMR